MKYCLRKICAVGLALCIVFCSFPLNFGKAGSSQLAGYTVIYGDTNLDGKVSTADISLLMKYCNGLVKLQATQLFNSDVNCDKKVNTADITLIMRYITGIIPALPLVSAENRKVELHESTLPKSGMRLPLNQPYSLDGEIISHVPITSVNMKIIDIATGKTEINESIYFSVGVYSYEIKNSSHSLDRRIKFAKLGAGEKRLEFSCSTKLDSNLLVYSCNFNMGFTYTELYGKVFDKGDIVSTEITNKILGLLNSYDITSDNGAKILSHGVNYLGKKYSQMDCSNFVLTTYKNALNISLPRISSDQAKFCADNNMLIDYSELQPGDLVFMRRNDCGCDRYHDIHHSAIYLGEVDGVKYLIESTSSLNGVVIREIWGLNGGKWQIDCCARPYN